MSNSIRPPTRARPRHVRPRPRSRATADREPEPAQRPGPQPLTRYPRQSSAPNSRQRMRRASRSSADRHHVLSARRLHVGEPEHGEPQGGEGEPVPTATTARGCRAIWCGFIGGCHRTDLPRRPIGGDPRSSPLGLSARRQDRPELRVLVQRRSRRAAWRCRSGRSTSSAPRASSRWPSRSGAFRRNREVPIRQPVRSVGARLPLCPPVACQPRCEPRNQSPRPTPPRPRQPLEERDRSSPGLPDRP